MQQLVPSNTLYVSNLPDKENKEELKRNLYTLFSEHGVILEINARKSPTTRGQAFIVFKDLKESTAAHRALDSFTFLGKALKIQYSKNQSHVLDKAKGIWEPPAKKEQEKRKTEKRRREEQREITVLTNVSAALKPSAPFETFQGFLRASVVGAADRGMVQVQAQFTSLEAAQEAIRRLTSQSIKAIIKTA